MASLVSHQAAGLAARRDARRADPDRSSAQEQPRTLRLGLISGKGGVGKSALAVNLAVGAARAGSRVLLIDADAGLANTDLLLGLVPEFDLDDWLQGACATKELLCTGPHGLSLLMAGASAASRLTLHGLLTGRGPEPLAGMFEGFELIIVDLGAGVSEPVVRLASHCESVWLVATPEPTSLADAYATAKKLFEIDPERSLELVVNRFVAHGSASRTHESLNRMLNRFLGKSIALRGSVPEDPALVRSVARQSPVVLAPGRSESARRVELMAESLIEEQRALGARGAEPTRSVGPS